MTIVAAVALAVTGAVCFGLAAYLQHDAVRRDRLRRAVRRPGWLVGLALIGPGAALHAVALALAPLVVVQPIGVLALPLVAALHARSARIRLGGAARLAIAATALGVALFVWVAAAGVADSAAPLSAYTRVIWLAALATAALVTLGAVGRGRRRCLAFATGAGVAFALVSVVVRGLGHHFATGGRDVPLILVLTLVAALAVGGVLVQLGYASGPPAVVVACLTIVDPLVSVGAGIGLLGETSASATGWTVGVGAACALLAVAGTLALARHHPEAAARSTPITHPVKEPSCI
ncbi:MAG: hypothetical protein GEU94_21750 [Micromonosporaceae bacterium]|nr:hypothetical protein [Micromonosporaceae bacterium]